MDIARVSGQAYPARKRLPVTAMSLISMRYIEQIGLGGWGFNRPAFVYGSAHVCSRVHLFLSYPFEALLLHLPVFSLLEPLAWQV